MKGDSQHKSRRGLKTRQRTPTFSGSPIFVIEAFLAGTGEAVMLPKSKESFYTLAYGLGHLLEAMDCRGFCFVAPEREGISCGVYTVGHSIDIAKIFLHHRRGAKVCILEAELLE